MTIDNINIEATLKKAEELLKEEKGLSLAMKSMVELLLLVITLLVKRLNLTSSNSSKPPSQDENRAKKDRKKTGKKQGGQKGHNGKTLEKVSNPDETIDYKVDKCVECQRDLSVQEADGYETRQVFEAVIKRVVIEHKAEVKKCVDCGTISKGEFPEEVSKAVQYGTTVKSLSVYMLQYQLIPYNRVEEFFCEQLDMPLSSGTIFNFNEEAFNRLKKFEERVKTKLLESSLNHSDETGLNIDGKRHWLHSISNETWTLFYPHKSKGNEAIDAMGVVPKYKGLLCHDYYKAYYKYDCIHVLCNSHHLRELERSYEQDNQNWSRLMKYLLLEINKAVIKSGGKLDELEQKRFEKRYRAILSKGKKECPLQERRPGQRGRTAQSKSRNLLDRLENREDEVLRFMKVKIVPFTNNLAERDIRMTKVHQKISGCFRSMQGAKIFCRIRSYLSTARKNSITSIQALALLFTGNIPDFNE